MIRKRQFYMNVVTGICKQLVMLVCGFIIPRYIIAYYGSTVNGLVSSIAHFLKIISLLDMGVGVVVQANLYGPLAKNDNSMISRIVKSSERFFQRLAFIFVAYIIILCIIFPNITNFDTWYTVSLIFTISITIYAQYLWGMTYQLLLNADQKSYIPQLIQISTIVLNAVLSISLMRIGASIHIVKLMTSFVFAFRPLVQMVYVRRHYRLEQIQIIDEPIKQKWNGFAQHLAEIICQNIDVIVLTFFSTLECISIYTIYFNVVSSVEQVLSAPSTAFGSIWGNMIVMKEKGKLIDSFDIIEWVTHTVVTMIFTVTGITIVPFIAVYLKDISDADYIVPLFSMLLIMAYGIKCLRIPYSAIVKAAGHFKETQIGAFISTGLNVVVTIALITRFELVGAAFGTLVAIFFYTLYLVWYLRKNILYRSVRHFIKCLSVDCIVAAGSYFLTKGMRMNVLSYSSWVLLGVKVFAVTAGVSLIVNLVFHRNQISNLIQSWMKHRA